jgi:hypothetical protein
VVFCPGSIVTNLKVLNIADIIGAVAVGSTIRRMNFLTNLDSFGCVWILYFAQLELTEQHLRRLNRQLNPRLISFKILPHMEGPSLRPNHKQNLGVAGINLKI